MRYEERTLVALVCDRCGMRGPWALYRNAARVWAEMNGWKVDGDAALCPDCQEEQEQKQEDPNAL
jgi:hypothetical protein